MAVIYVGIRNWQLKIPKRGKIYQMVKTLPNGQTIYQMVVIYSQQLAIENTNFFHSKALQNVPKLVWKHTIWQPCTADKDFKCSKLISLLLQFHNRWKILKVYSQPLGSRRMCIHLSLFFLRDEYTTYVHVHVFAIHVWMCYTCMHVLHMHVCVIHACMCYTCMYVLYMHVCVIHACMCYTCMYVLHMYVLHMYVLHMYVLHMYVLHMYVLHMYVLHMYICVIHVCVCSTYVSRLHICWAVLTLTPRYVVIPTYDQWVTTLAP
jgi:hypothetical protein